MARKDDKRPTHRSQPRGFPNAIKGGRIYNKPDKTLGFAAADVREARAKAKKKRKK